MGLVEKLSSRVRVLQSLRGKDSQVFAKSSRYYCICG